MTSEADKIRDYLTEHGPTPRDTLMADLYPAPGPERVIGYTHLGFLIGDRQVEDWDGELRLPDQDTPPAPQPGPVPGEIKTSAAAFAADLAVYRDALRAQGFGATDTRALLAAFIRANTRLD